MTARKVFENLEQLGFLYRRASKGPFVVPQKIEQSPPLLIGFAKKMKAQGHEPITTLDLYPISWTHRKSAIIVT